MNAYTFAAYLAHPHLGIPDSLAKEKIAISEVQRVLKANKVLFRSFIQYDSGLSSRKENAMSNLICHSKETSHYYDFYEIVKKELLDAIGLLNNNVQTLFIKSSNILPLDSDNFDILIPDNKQKMADQVLRKNGFSVVKVAEEPHKVLYRKTKNGKDYLALHLHTKIVWGGVEFLRAEEIWKKYSTKNIQGTNVGFISPEHAVLVTLAHAFYENASLKLCDILYLVDSFSDSSLDLDAMISSSVKMGWDLVFGAMLLYGNSIHHEVYGFPIIPVNRLNEVVSEALSEEKTVQVKNLHEKMRISFRKKPYLPVPITLRNYRGRQLISQVVSNDSLSLVDKVNKLRYLLSAFLKGTLPRKKPKIAISFIGVDASGKTTHARRLVDAFRKRGIGASHVWSRGGFRLSEPLMSRATSIVSSHSNVKSHRELSEARLRHVKANPFLGKILMSMLLFEHAAHIRSKLILGKSSKNVIVFDRFLHDTVVDSLIHYGQDYNSFLSRLMLNLAGRIASKPDLIVLLKASPQTIESRRPEEDLERIRLKSRIYESWSKRWRAHVVDTERYTIEQNHLNILGKALSLFYEGGTERR
jgi:thymidylate kinase